ncbi:DNA-binding transcriptional regulator, AcrR family [Pedococcus dokdonensis]|uniref:DNA-binding transcriptional regulator, AcrR family n=1 Tax=Pedococcus dokdonensis TaxID=443156 RepID=A0A1H0TEM9_9MICO|nr:TetR/AcrR family transcriptional regulator [Pedococcus dokdonensis]SDP52512.1 DNA-binding transcriptional regulator, AcrR family [Pedococcus dokdonensis]
MATDPATRAASAPRRGRGRPRGSGSEATAATRERIVAAAAELFADRGFHATPMTAVAEAAGLSQSGLLHHFPTKEGLLAEVLRERDVRDLATLATARPHPPRGWEVWEDMTTLVRLNSDREALVRLFTSLAGEAVDPEHPGHGWLGEHHRSAVETLATALRDAEADGAARAGIPAESLARQAVALMDGLQLQWLMRPGDLDMAGDFAEFVATVRARWTP